MNYNHIPPDIMTKFLTDDLSPEERRSAELHIAVCPECAAKLDEQRRFEDAAARSYPRTFSGRLDPDCAKAIEDAVRERLNTSIDSPTWVRRIRGTVAIQLGTVAAVALLLLVMIVAPSDKAGGAKEKKSVAAALKTEDTLTPDKIPVPSAPVAPVTEKAEIEAPSEVVPETAVPEQKAEAAAEPEPLRTRTEEEKKTIALPAKSVLNPGLVRIFALDEISLRPPEKETFRQGVVCMDSPFEPGVRILLAVSDSEKRIGFRIRPEGETILRSLLSKNGEEDAVSAALLPETKETPEFVFVKVIPSEDSVVPIAVSMKDILKDGENAPAPLRLAAVMHAAGQPRLLLNREIREKMLGELRTLVKNEYADNSRVAGFLEKLEKVK